MAKHKPESEPETVADESTLQTGTPDETIAMLNVGAIIDIAEQVSLLHTTSVDEIQNTYARRLAEQLIERAALDAQDPIVYRYNGNAAAGESMAHVPLADIRQSLWDELEPYMQAGVEASHLYTKAEV